MEKLIKLSNFIKGPEGGEKERERERESLSVSINLSVVVASNINSTPKAIAIRGYLKHACS